MENNCRIIHVAGPLASGKSSLGDRLKNIIILLMKSIMILK